MRRLVDGDASVVDPGVKTAKTLLDDVADALHIRSPTHVGDDVSRPPTVSVNLVLQLSQFVLVPRHQHQTVSPPRNCQRHEWYTLATPR
jgi:hypothetical protein